MYIEFCGQFFLLSLKTKVISIIPWYSEKIMSPYALSRIVSTENGICPMKCSHEASFGNLCLGKGNPLVVSPGVGILRATGLVDAGSELSLCTCLMMGRAWVKSVHRELSVVSGYLWIYRAPQTAKFLSLTVNALCYLQYCIFL